MILANHRAKLTGNIFATRIAYVGEHVLNIGHNTAPRAISPPTPRLMFAFDLFDQCSRPILPITVCRMSGKKRNTQNTIRMIAETFVRASTPNPNWSNNRLAASVKNNTDTANERIIIHGCDFFPSLTEPPIITGNSGNTQGATIVIIHDINDKNNKLISLANIKNTLFVM